MQMTKYLSTKQVIDIHDEIIHKTGGLKGIRDIKLLESAINAPQIYLFEAEMYQSIYEKSLIYLYHIIKNHPFIDGNKRTAYATVCIFFKINDCEMNYKDSLEHLCIAIANGSIDKHDLLHNNLEHELYKDI